MGKWNNYAKKLQIVPNLKQWRFAMLLCCFFVFKLGVKAEKPA